MALEDDFALKILNIVKRTAVAVCSRFEIGHPLGCTMVFDLFDLSFIG